jgi:tRNA 2-thiouridine synthesizing protein B
MLHIVNKSPFEKNSLASCLRLSSQGASILMIEDGVYGAIKDTDFSADVLSSLQQKKVYALGPDLKARGIDLTRLIEGVEVVDYDGFVHLAAAASKTQSWM